ncbi:YigZ family protein [Paracoccus sp. S-4012]|uniref:YigZ family protein n=1 Tax=Paracoccus sp. S-4012 TaxID=2665648 RepID=UPI0012AFDDB6|nr:YigZ family protein [Paracoccus sp. S-4012]MRX51111.1 YigZ family protein [Paracoccus sp. S-4012]
MSLRILDRVLSDRGSRYAAAGGPAATRAEAEALLAALKRQKRFQKATHNSWAAILGGEAVKADDGEAGAGAIILAELEAAGARDTLLVVTRWYGGKPLGGDRFRHVRTAARAWLAEAR